MPLPTMTEKKRAITVIMQKMKGNGTESGGTGYKKEGESDATEPRSDASAAKSGAMHRFMSALEQKNPDEMASALETFLELCEHKEESTEEEEY